MVSFAAQRPTLSVLAVSGLLLVSACSDAGESTDAGPRQDAAQPEQDAAQPKHEPIATFEEYCAAEADSYCSMLETCCVAADAAFEREVCDRDVLSFSAPPLSWCNQTPRSFDGAAAAECLALRVQLRADCRLPRSDDALAVEAARVCERVAVFTRGSADTSCETTPCFAPPGMVSICNNEFDGDSIPNCTEPIERASLGQSCAGSARPCDYGLACIPNVCAKLLPDGAECNQDWQCSSNECTDSGSGVETRRCEPVREVGWMECEIFNDPRIPHAGP